MRPNHLWLLLLLGIGILLGISACDIAPPELEPAPVVTTPPPPALPVEEDTPVTEPNTATQLAFAEEASRHFANYFAHYRAYFPDMTVGDFDLTDSRVANSFYRYDTPIDLNTWKADFGDYATLSPDGQYWLDVISYDIVRGPDGKWAAGSPDSEAALINAATGERIRLLFCGTACSFADGFWLDGNTVVVAGLTANATGFQPALWRIYLDTRRIESFAYPMTLVENQRAYVALPND